MIIIDKNLNYFIYNNYAINFHSANLCTCDLYFDENEIRFVSFTENIKWNLTLKVSSPNRKVQLAFTKCEIQNIWF